MRYQFSKQRLTGGVRGASRDLQCLRQTYRSVAFVLIMLLAGCAQESSYQELPPAKVGVVSPIVDDVPIYLVENGELEAVEQALVQARVRGILQEFKFEPDSLVEKGAELFLIEQEEYITDLKAAEANLNSAKAELETANAAVDVADAGIGSADAKIKVFGTEYERMQGLSDSKAISERELDAAVARLETANAEKLAATASKTVAEAEVSRARAQVEQAEADLAQARLDLERTVVKAPISGRISRTLVKRGNLVEDGTPLIEIVKNNPIWANFNINERFLLNIDRDAPHRNERPAELSQIKVELQRNGDVGYPFQGHLDYVDPKVDQDTATLTVRAVFENPPEQKKTLMPGLFVRVRVQVGEYTDALLIPERAIERDRIGAYVYVVDQQNKAVRKNIVLGSKLENRIVVESGLNQNDRVIVDGMQRVRQGTVVDPEPIE